MNDLKQTCNCVNTERRCVLLMMPVCRESVSFCRWFEWS